MEAPAGSRRNRGFFVPVARVESGEYQRPAAAAGSLSQPLPVPVPVAAISTSAGPLPAMQTQSAPVIWFMPLQQMAERLAAARIQGGSSMPLMPPAAQQAAGLVRTNRVQIPSNLPLATLSRMPHTQLESLVREYYRRLGYDVAALGTGNDSESIDLLLHRKGEIIVVKCLTGGAEKVPPDPVRELLGLVMGGSWRACSKPVPPAPASARPAPAAADRCTWRKRRSTSAAAPCQGVLRPGQTAAAPAKRLAA